MQRTGHENTVMVLHKSSTLRVIMFWYVSNILDDLIVLSFNETNARN